METLFLFALVAVLAGGERILSMFGRRRTVDDLTQAIGARGELVVAQGELLAWTRDRLNECMEDRAAMRRELHMPPLPMSPPPPAIPEAHEWKAR